mmetsp:Transcript_80237/g.158954  ORF Transcript_80237/g.158954 Transcript_80237/m.158954 type:complete len:92 (+) Transcript_80237:729-1004(+)|eukprot:CAMPEP_0172678902 /NCGR_PEP_ID=MMETSP1074-20121228/15705_2 /TAXON_ID=2916 /ORGANISM="Ceratium fusus, Strain PA161109" /LENGTH=91 /DNA_ID=CAMNT_0013497005 /DNA_START=110 /DNA_END=388 /DNA_ORIENTATION=-
MLVLWLKPGLKEATPPMLALQHASLGHGRPRVREQIQVQRQAWKAEVKEGNYVTAERTPSAAGAVFHDHGFFGHLPSCRAPPQIQQPSVPL